MMTMKKRSVADITRLLGNLPPAFPQRCFVRLSEDCYEAATMIGLDDEGEIVLRYEDGQTESGINGPDEIFVEFDVDDSGRKSGTERRCSTPYRNGRCTCRRVTVACVCAPRGCTFSVVVRVCRVPKAAWWVCSKCLPAFAQPSVPGGILSVGVSLAGMSGFGVSLQEANPKPSFATKKPH